MTTKTTNEIKVWTQNASDKARMFPATAHAANPTEDGRISLEVIGPGVSVTVNFASAADVHELAIRLLRLSFEKAARGGK